MTLNTETHVKKNEDAIIYVNGKFLHKKDATVSVFDSGFMMGDGVWEGLRLVNNNWLFLDEHLDRLFEAAKAIDLDIGLSRQEITTALKQTQSANRMTDQAHARLMITRGVKTNHFKGLHTQCMVLLL